MQKNLDEALTLLPSGRLKHKPDFISVTRGPGMRSNLSCGLDTAKGLAVAWSRPLLAVHHMQAHLLTPRLAEALKVHSKPHVLPSADRPVDKKSQVLTDFPFLTLLVSGGHTMLLHSRSLTEHTLLADTRDIAVGDALDKIGRLVLPQVLSDRVRDTAFAAHLSRYAYPTTDTFAMYPVPINRGDEIHKKPNAFGWSIDSPLAETKLLAFSFSGIASRTQSLFEARQRIVEGGVSDEERLVFARTVLGISFEHLASRTVMAMNHLRDSGQEPRKLVVSGGVAANGFLRYFLRKMIDARNLEDVELVFPPSELCTDNAAMIAWTGIEMYEAGWRSSLSCGPLRKWSMDAESDDGGIVGIDGWRKVNSRTVIDQRLDQGTPEAKVTQKALQPNLRRTVKHDRLPADNVIRN